MKIMTNKAWRKQILQKERKEKKKKKKLTEDGKKRNKEKINKGKEVK